MELEYKEPSSIEEQEMEISPRAATVEEARETMVTDVGTTHTRTE